ncbi:MAG: hypothetical protein V4446_11345 [Pseudomonadota bacterium]
MKLTLPFNAHQFDSLKACAFRIEGLKIDLHGRSYKNAATMENLVGSSPAPVVGWLNIGLLHYAGRLCAPWEKKFWRHTSAYRRALLPNGGISKIGSTNVRFWKMRRSLLGHVRKFAFPDR